MFCSGTAVADFIADELYIATLRAANIFPISCIDMQGNVGAATWKTTVTNWGRKVGAGVFELGNEEPRTFGYDGVAGSNWNRYLVAVEDACQILHDLGRVPILGAALDVETNLLLAAARAKWGADWSATNKPDGVAIHPYGQSGATYTQLACLQKAVSRLQQARDPAFGNLPNTVPIWITEMGWGVSGNTNSTLVLTRDSKSGKTKDPTNSTPPLPQTIGGAGPWTVYLDDVSDFSATGGFAFLFPLGKFSYAGKNGGGAGPYSLLGCSGGASQSIPNNTPVGTWEGPTGTSNAEQADILTHIFQGAPGIGFGGVNASGLWGRRNGRVSKTNVYPAGTGLDLYLKNICWFIGADYGAAPNGNWANQCGLFNSGLGDLPPGTWSGAGFNAAKRPSYAAFAAEDPSRPLS